MSMPQVYLTEYDDKDRCSDVFSSKQKAISHCNREFDHPDFVSEKHFTLVSVAGSTVGWITKKIVQ